MINSVWEDIHNWKLDNYEECLVYSDYLLDLGYTKQSDIVRWGAEVMFFSNSWDLWRKAYPCMIEFLTQVLVDLQPSIYDRWKKFAEKEGYKIYDHSNND